jgi:hypothetical protein
MLAVVRWLSRLLSAAMRWVCWALPEAVRNSRHTLRSGGQLRRRRRDLADLQLLRFDFAQAPRSDD